MAVTIPGTTHGLGTANLLAQVYDGSVPSVAVLPGSLTVDATTFDVVFDGVQTQAGTFILTSATPQFVQTFTAQTSVTITGATHGLGTSNLLYAVYDNGSPRQAIGEGAVTVHPTTHDVVVTFLQAQTGRMILWAPSTVYAAAFSGQTTLSIPQATHGLNSAALLWQLYDASTPAQALEPGGVTVHQTTHDVVITFAQAQSGTVVLAPAFPSYVTTVGLTLFLIAVSDTLTVGESTPVTRVSLFAISVTDAVTIGEPLTLDLVLFLSGLDAITVGESVPVLLVSKPSVTEALTVGDTLSLQALLFSTVAEALTVGETVPVGLLLSMAVTETVSLGETTTVVRLFQVLVIDALTVGESTGLQLLLFPQVSEALTLGESTPLIAGGGVLILENITVADPVVLLVPLLLQTIVEAVTIGESVGAMLLDRVAVTDALTVGETLLLELVLFPSVTDALTVGETRNLQLLSLPSVTETLTIGESTSVVVSGVGTVVVETLAVTETVVLLIPFVGVAMSESVTMNELVAPMLLDRLVVSDALTIGEVSSLQVVCLPSVTDAMTLGESVTPQSLVFPVVTEAVTVGELLTLRVPFLAPTILEAVTVGENVLLGSSVLISLFATEAMTVADVVTVVVPFALIASTESLTVGDSSTLVARVTLTTSDGATVDDAVGVLGLAFVLSTETVTTGESVTCTLFTGFAVTEAVTVAETVTSQSATLIQTTEGLALGESTPLLVPIFPCAVLEVVDVMAFAVFSGAVGCLVSDGVLVGESLAMTLTLTTAVMETALTTDSQAVAVLLQPHLLEGVSVTEAVSFGGRLTIALVEVVTVEATAPTHFRVISSAMHGTQDRLRSSGAGVKDVLV